MRVLAGALLLLTACQTGPAEGPGAVDAEPSPSPAATVAIEDEPPAQPEPGTTLRYAVAEPQAIVPPDVVDADGLVVADALFDTLTAQSAGFELGPGAAVRWRPNADASEWTFVLRRGATFHDGSPVTAADFAFSWSLAAREGTAGYHLVAVEGYEAVVAGEADALSGVSTDGDHVLHVRLRHPYADFPATAAHPALAPVPQAAWEADPAAFRERPVGNGPFRMAEDWARGRFIRVNRFDEWANGPRPPLSEVLFQVMDPDSGYLAFQQGRLDVTPLPPGALEDAVARFGRSVDGYGGPGVLTGDTAVLYYLGFDLTRPPFDDPDVRRALSLAIDTERIAAETLEGNVAVARTAAPPVVPGGRRRSCPTCRHDPAAAGAVFADREISQLTLWFNRHGGHEEVARLVREDLAEIGVRLVFRTEEFPVYLTALEAGDASLFRFGWSLDYPTYDEALYPLFHSSSVPPGEAAYNYGRYRSEEVDALLDEARATLDAEERRRLFQRAEALLLRDQAIVPVMTYRHRVVVSERLHGFRLDALGRANLADVSVRPTEP